MFISEPLLRGRYYVPTVHPLAEDLVTHLLDVGAGTGWDPQRPGQSPTPRGQLDAFLSGMDMCSTPREAPPIINPTARGGVRVGNQANQQRHRFSRSAPDTCSDGFSRGTNDQVYSPSTGSCAGGGAPESVDSPAGPPAGAATGLGGAASPVPTPLSGRMSILHPVSRAANRAF